MVRQRSKTKKSLLRPTAFFLAVVLVAGAILTTLELTNTTHLFHKQKPQSKTIVTVGQPVAPPSHTSENAKQPSERTLATNNSPSGGATDTRGSATSNTNSSQWVTSDTGYITVKSPVANAKLQDGATLVGTAKVGQVGYRLTDNSIGVVAQGQLAVTDGKFSGTLHFQPKGTGGRLDVFSTDASGTEYNEIQINVSY